MPRVFDAELTPVLEGRIVRLEPLTQAHADPLWEAAQDERTFTWIEPALAATRERFDAYLAEAFRAQRAGEEGPFATVDARTGQVIGTTRYMAVRAADRGVEIGSTWMAPSHWRTGANVEAKLLMLSHAFERLGCMRVELKTHSRNERSRNAILALGATLEGIHRKHRLVPGLGVRDSAWYLIVDDEWPAVRRRLEARLARHAPAGGSPSARPAGRAVRPRHPPAGG